MITDNGITIVNSNTLIMQSLSAFISGIPIAQSLQSRLLQSKRIRSFIMPRRHNIHASAVPLSSTIDVHIIPILSDNYSYLIHDKAAGVAVLVDPAEPEKLLEVASNLNARVVTSFTTHHHWDHAGGNAQLASLKPGIPIIGSAYETAEAVTKKLNTGDTYDVPESSISMTAVRTPCHTQGHLCYKFNAEKKAVFTGDTLFVAGCGKFFEGNASDMEGSLNNTLASLDPHTLVFCGHEYTLTNLKFALSVEPENNVIKEKLEWAQEQLEQGNPTVPSTIGGELSWNPFMRTSDKQIADALKISDATPTQVMKRLREEKNKFRP